LQVGETSLGGGVGTTNPVPCPFGTVQAGAGVGFPPVVLHPPLLREVPEEDDEPSREGDTGDHAQQEQEAQVPPGVHVEALHVVHLHQRVCKHGAQGGRGEVHCCPEVVSGAYQPGHGRPVLDEYAGDLLVTLNNAVFL
jgi:hypothetical protein